MRIWRPWSRRSRSVEPDELPDLPQPDGLPPGITPPPDDGLASIQDYLWKDIEEGSQTGNPQRGAPLRPLPAEEVVVHRHDEAQLLVSAWRQGAAGELAGLVEANSDAIDSVTEQESAVGESVARLTDEVQEQGEQLVERHRRYISLPKPLARVMTALFLAALVIEIWVQTPLVGRVLDLSPVETLATATFIVGVSTGVSYLAAFCWNRTLQFDGPPRMRWLYAASAILGLATALAFVVGVTGIRVATARQLGDDFATAVFLFAGLQLGIQLVAAAHGWHAGDPRVAQLSNTRDELARQQERQTYLAELRDWLVSTQEVLASFNLGSWTQQHREAVAQGYAALIKASRNDRAYELQRLNFDDAADLLALLPLPKFVVPDEEGPDDDWMSGGFLVPLK